MGIFEPNRNVYYWYVSINNADNNKNSGEAIIMFWCWEPKAVTWKNCDLFSPILNSQYRKW